MSKSRKAPYVRPRASAERLDERILFSGDAVAAVTGVPPGQVSVSQIQVAPPAPSTPISANDQISASHELVIIDRGVEQYDLLVSDIQHQQAAGRAIQVVLVGPDQNVFDVITDALASSQTPYSAIHIISHGHADQLDVGSTGINSATVNQNALKIAAWSQWLTASADIELYGCDFAKTAPGRNTLMAISQLSGADVAASIDTTGHRSLNGNWALESQVGTIDAPVAISLSAQSVWIHDLGTATGEAPIVVSAGQTTSGSQFANGNTSSQSVINLTNTNAGKTVVFWIDADSNKSYATILDSNNAVQSHIELAHTNGHENSVVITGDNLESGGFIVAITTADTTDPRNGRIILIKYGADLTQSSVSYITGATVGAPGSAYIPSIATGAADSYLLVFEVNQSITSGTGNTADTNGLAYIYDAGGTGNPTRHQTYFSAGFDLSSPAVTTLSNGRFAVFSQSRSQTTGQITIEGVIADPSLTVISDPTAVSFSNIDPAVNEPISGDQSNASVVALPNGGFAVAWIEKISEPIARMCIYDSNGLRTVSALAVSESASFPQSDVHLAVDHINKLIIATWTINVGLSVPQTDVVYRTFKLDGTPIEASSQAITTDFTGNQTSARAVAVGDRVNFIWNGYSATDTDGGVSLRRFTFPYPGIATDGLDLDKVYAEGEQITFSVLLTEPPTSFVNVQVRGSTQTLTFDPTDWSTPQSITISIAKVPGLQGLRVENFAFTLNSLDLNFDTVARTAAGQSTNSLNLNLQDTPLLTVTLPINSPASFAEGAPITFNARLTGNPGQVLNLFVAGITTGVTFDNTNWSNDQTFTLNVPVSTGFQGTRPQVFNFFTNQAGGVGYPTLSTNAVATILDSTPAVTVSPVTLAGPPETEGAYIYFDVTIGSPSSQVTYIKVNDEGVAEIAAGSTTVSARFYVDHTIAIEGNALRDFTIKTQSLDPNFDGISIFTQRVLGEAPQQNLLTVTSGADTVNVYDPNGNTPITQFSVYELLASKQGAPITLREALIAANYTAPLTSGAPIEINFAIPSSQTIFLTTPLPDIRVPVNINGGITTAQFNPGGTITNTIKPGINLLLDPTAGITEGIVLSGGAKGTFIQGLAIAQLSGAGISVYADNVTIQNNYFGTDISATQALGIAGDGIYLANVNGNTIANNLIVGAGIGISANTITNLNIQSNKIGVLANETGTYGNRDSGIQIYGVSQAIVIRDNLIGGNGTSGSAPGMGGGSGIFITGASVNQISIYHNAIGTDFAGNINFGNNLDGIAIQNGASNIKIGSLLSNEVNVIRYNYNQAIHVYGTAPIASPQSFSSNVTVLWNRLLSNDLTTGNFAPIALASAGEYGFNLAPNDPTDADVGQNGALNSLENLSATQVGSGLLRLSATYQGAPNASFFVQIYSYQNKLGQPIAMYGQLDNLVSTIVFSTNEFGIGKFDYIVTGQTPALDTLFTATVTEGDPATSFGASSQASAPTALLQSSLPTLTTNTNAVVPENSLFSTTLTAVNNSGALSFSYELTPTNDARFFQIDSTNPAAVRLLFKAPADFEQALDANADNVYSIDIKITDSFGSVGIQTFNLTITNVNEVAGASILSLIDPSPEDQTILFTASSPILGVGNRLNLGPTVVFFDPDSDLTPHQLLLTLSDAQLTFGQTSGLTASSSISGTTQTILLTGSISDINSAMASARLTPVLNYFGPVTLNLTLTDIATRANQIVNTMSFSYFSVNDNPTAVSNTLAVADANPVVLSNAQLNAQDIETPSALLLYTLETLPNNLALDLDGVALIAGASFKQSDIDSGRLTVRSLSGISTTESLGFTVTDGDAGSTVALLNVQITLPPPIVTPPAPVPTPAPTPAPVPISPPIAPNPTPAPAPIATPPALVIATVIAPATATIADTESGTPPVKSGTALASFVPPQAPSNSGQKSESRSNLPKADTTMQAGAKESEANLNQNRTNIGALIGGNQLAKINKSNDAISSAQEQAGSSDTKKDSPNALAISAEDLKVQGTAQMTWERATLAQTSFAQEVDQVRKSASQPIELEKAVVASTMAVSTGVSLGYVIWLLRGGVLLSSLLASLPAWRSIDPLPVLMNLNGRNKNDGEDDSLQNMLKKAREKMIKKDVETIN
jgi:hypothetical protein